LLGLGVAATLGACATLSEQPPRYASLSQIHAGLTQDEVRGIAGAPAYVGSNKRTNETLWTYNYTDEFGYRSEFGVDFDKASGLVKDTSTQRVDEE
jgi:hypothetical protein